MWVLTVTCPTGEQLAGHQVGRLTISQVPFFWFFFRRLYASSSVQFTGVFTNSPSLTSHEQLRTNARWYSYMTCFFPVDAWKSRKRNESGKRPLVFNQREGYSDQYLQIPCGKCLGCMADRSKDWATRIHNESTLHERNAFLTLTYNDKHLPTDGKLNKEHLQKFIRSLRDAGNKLRYFACGEYGGVTQRPHYHAIIFGMDFLSPTAEPCGSNGEFVNFELNEIWGRGNCMVAPVTPASCAYVAGYCNKKIGDPDVFQLMSRRPGIGHDWIDRNHDDVRRAGAVVSEDGKISRVPRRYMEWQEKNLEQVKFQRQKYVREMPIEKKMDLRREAKAKQVCAEQRARERKIREKIGR